MPSTAAISSTASSPRSVSIWAMTRLRRSASLILSLRIARRVVVMGEAEGGAAPALAWDSAPDLAMPRACSALSTIGTMTPCAPTSSARAMKWYSPRGTRTIGTTPVPRLAATSIFSVSRPSPRVLHVVDGVLGAGVAQDLRHAGHEELEHHRAQHRLAGQRALADRILRHPRSPTRPGYCLPWVSCRRCRYLPLRATGVAQRIPPSCSRSCQCPSDVRTSALSYR